IATRNVILDDGLEFLCDAITLESDRALAVHEHRRGGQLAGARQADADIGMPALTRTVHDTPHHSDIHRLHAGVLAFPYRHLGSQVGLDAVSKFLKEAAAGATATRACNDHGCKG